MRKFFTLLALTLLSVGLFANKQISGTVVDEKDEPVIGASIVVNGTTLGTITDVDGLFEISVPMMLKPLRLPPLVWKSRHWRSSARCTL